MPYLHLFYDEVLIPEAVEREFLRGAPSVVELKETSERFDFLLKFYEVHGGWFKKCNDYNQAEVQLYFAEPDLDAGESEVFAQDQVRGQVHTLLIDEKAARKFAKVNNRAVNGVLYLLAKLHLQLNLCDYQQSWKRLRDEIHFHVNERVAGQVWQAVLKEIG